MAGKTNFGFFSKYKKGATVPTGETEFRFKVADLNFHSTEYEWLVVAGPRAQSKGSGTINGAGDSGSCSPPSTGRSTAAERSASIFIAACPGRRSDTVHPSSISQPAVVR